MAVQANDQVGRGLEGFAARWVARGHVATKEPKRAQRGYSSLGSLVETAPMEKRLIALDFSGFPELLQLRPVQLFDAVSVFFCEQIRFATIFTAPYNVPLLSMTSHGVSNSPST